MPSSTVRTFTDPDASFGGIDAEAQTAGMEGVKSGAAGVLNDERRGVNTRSIPLHRASRHRPSLHNSSRLVDVL
jgi:hypothetical protein